MRDRNLQPTTGTKDTGDSPIATAGAGMSMMLMNAVAASKVASANGSGVASPWT